jgi:hypothetical protein
MLQNRISIELKGDNIPAEYPSTVIARLREIYEENITSTSHLLPRLPDNRADMLECYLSSQTHHAEGSVLVAEIEGNRIKFDIRQGR